ncbi:MAG: hypothetical protein D6800_08340 [Candidatus Zixiibacteriota bacterium]|nr:MAG: hypothetical protein D6800_08340 [candidate division Zixibacteria bacterium]
MAIRDTVAKVKLRHWQRSVEPKAHRFPDDLLTPKRLLVCLPSGLRELTLVKQFLPAITYLFKPADITLLTAPGVRVSDIYPRKGFQILSPSTDQLTWSGLPRKSYLKLLREYKFDAVLDLNLQATVFTTAVLLNFPEAIRIGCGNIPGRPFYNLEIKTKYLRDERNIYRSLLETLGVIMNRRLDALRPAGIG